MERMKRKNVFRAGLIIFLAVIAVSLLVMWIRWENSHATYKNYDIVVKKNVYCEKTQTGRVDLQIRRKGGKKAKLLQTQQELKQSQSFQIVEDSYKLGIVDDASAYDGNIYEQKNAGGTQYLTLYYVNHEASGRQGKMHLVMNDVKTGKELINIKTSPKVKKDARRYEYRGKDLYVSEEGILLDAGTDEEFYNSQAMTTGLMTVCWKMEKRNRSSLIQMQMYQNMKLRILSFRKWLVREKRNLKQSLVQNLRQGQNPKQCPRRSRKLFATTMRWNSVTGRTFVR